MPRHTTRERLGHTEAGRTGPGGKPSAGSLAEVGRQPREVRLHGLEYRILRDGAGTRPNPGHASATSPPARAAPPNLDILPGGGGWWAARVRVVAGRSRTRTRGPQGPARSPRKGHGRDDGRGYGGHPCDPMKGEGCRGESGAGRIPERQTTSTARLRDPEGHDERNGRWRGPSAEGGMPHARGHGVRGGERETPPRRGPPPC